MSIKVTHSKNDSTGVGGDPKAPTNVNSLRKLFESNFKLFDITKPFKSKNHRCQKSVRVERNTALVEDASCHRSPKSNKENRKKSGLTVSPAGCYLNCKIDNCCCKTFFRQYNETPIQRYRPKVPLQERNGNSRFDRHCPGRWSATSCSSYNLTKQQQLCNRLLQRPLDHHSRNRESEPCRNKFYNINYEFYKSKSQEIFDETPVSAVSTKHLERRVSRTGLGVNLLNKMENSMNLDENGDDVDSCKSHNESESETLFFQTSEASRFVNSTVAGLSESGLRNFPAVGKLVGNHLEERENANAVLSKRRNEVQQVTGQQNLLRKVDPDNRSMDPQAGARHISGFGFKCRLPKLKDMGLRENSYPYNVKNPRLTVKGVKNRNMRNVKRRRKSPERSALSRSHTFSGYDNFAYRRSIIDPQSNLELTDISADDSVNAFKPSADESTTNEKVGPVARVLRPASICAIGADDAQFHVDSRMNSYDWPVTSFYIERDEIQSLRASRRISSTFQVDARQSCFEKTANPATSKTNLKRYRSLGYLEEELFEHNFTKNHRSLENVNKVTCEILNLPEVNKIPNPKKFQNLDVHAHALFAAVEHGYVEKTKTILESFNVNVNSVNSDGLSPLDVALLSGNKSLVKLLVAYGAEEGRKLYGGDMHNHLCSLLHEAEGRLQELSGSLRLNVDTGQSTSNMCSDIPSSTIGDCAQNKTFSIWERRMKGLKRMLTGFEQIRPPDPPSVVTVEVTSTSSVMVYFTESDNENSSMTTKFKVQLSHDKDFLCLCGHYEVADTRQPKYHIKNLCKGQSYYVRVASGNIKGYSAYKLSTPPLIVPSSWQDVTKKKSRFTVSLRDALDGIFTSVLVDHPYLRNNAEMFAHGADFVVNQRRKKTSIKQLFTVSSKFQKHLKRGVYLACVLYCEDKVLVTNDEFLPVIEIDENYPKKIHNDFHWFFKVACNWNDLKWIKKDLEKLPNNSSVFRIKLLQAAAHMQNALGLQELGRIYYKMLRDVGGTIVISVINRIDSPKSVSVLNLRWLPLAKLNKRANLVNSFPSNLSDVLIASITDQITYHQVGKTELPRGLYLSYLKMRSSVDSLEVLVPFRTPNILPHCKIRDNPHVTADEWEWLVKKENFRERLAAATYQQKLFVEQVVVTAKRLFGHMNVPEEEIANHRLYDAEVIEVNEDISLIMVVPAAEISCSVSGLREKTLQRSQLLPLTVQAFEMINFETYQPDLISLYSKLSCVIEMDIDLAQYNLRQAFDDLEVNSAKCRLRELETLQAQLNAAWKNSKWLLDVISFARDRFMVPCVRMNELLSVHPKRALASIEPNCYLLSPNAKTAKLRGSWLDDARCRLNRMPSEISRSEQQSTQAVVPTSSAQTQIGCYVETSLPIKSAENEEIMAVSCSPSTSANETRHWSRKQKHNSGSATYNSSSSSVHSISSDEYSVSSSKVIRHHDSNIGDTIHVPLSKPSVIKVYAAYDTGLDSQIHFKFHVSPRTTARDIVCMFVKQMNMKIILQGRGRPIFSDKDLSSFCLVADDGTHEFNLRDDFLVKQFEWPRKGARLYVRHRNSLRIGENESQSSYV